MGIKPTQRSAATTTTSTPSTTPTLQTLESHRKADRDACEGRPSIFPETRAEGPIRNAGISPLRSMPPPKTHANIATHTRRSIFKSVDTTTLSGYQAKRTTNISQKKRKISCRKPHRTTGSICLSVTELGYARACATLRLSLAAVAFHQW